MPTKKKVPKGLIIGGAVGVGVLAIAGVATAIAVGKKKEPVADSHVSEPTRLLGGNPDVGYYIKYLPQSNALYGLIMSNEDNSNQFTTPRFPLSYEGFWALDKYLFAHKPEYSGILTENGKSPVHIGQSNNMLGVGTIGRFFSINTTVSKDRANTEYNKWTSGGGGGSGSGNAGEGTGALPQHQQAGIGGQTYGSGGGNTLAVGIDGLQIQRYSATPGFEDYSYMPVVPKVNISVPTPYVGTTVQRDAQHYGCFKKMFGKDLPAGVTHGYPDGVPTVVPMGASGISLNSYRPAESVPGDVWMGPIVEWDWTRGKGNHINLIRKYYKDAPTGNVDPQGIPLTRRVDAGKDIAMRLYGWQSKWYPSTNNSALMQEIRAKESVWNSSCPGPMGCARVTDAFLNNLETLIRRHYR